MDAGVSKGAFAAIIGVTPGRVSQYLTEGKISAGAIIGSGRNAKINVERAKQDLRSALDISQRMGNGLDTRLDPVASEPQPAASPSAPPPLMPGSGIDYEIKQQKLEQIRRANRNGAIEDAKARGRLIEADQAHAQLSRVAAAMLEIFEGGITDIALAVAAEYKQPQRDVKHLMKREFRKIRETAAKQMLLKQIDLPEVSETGLDAPDIEQADLS